MRRIRVKEYDAKEEEEEYDAKEEEERENGGKMQNKRMEDRGSEGKIGRGCHCNTAKKRPDPAILKRR